MQEGHIFTIEPIVCAGRGGTDCSESWQDGWTEVCIDKLPSAQFEHTLLITRDGVDILTKKLPTSPPFCV
jgi:methionyl aminopeptidase